MAQWSAGQYYSVGDEVVTGGSSPFTCILANVADVTNEPPNVT